MSKKLPFKMPTTDFPQMPTTGCNFTSTATTKTSTVISTVSKWVPLICAGAAVGVGVIALKEIKNVRKELINLKKEQLTKTTAVPETITKKIEELDEQLKKITEYLKTKSELEKRKRVVVQPHHPAGEVLKNVSPTTQPVKEVNVINEDEYEEIEVTDDES